MRQKHILVIGIVVGLVLIGFLALHRGTPSTGEKQRIEILLDWKMSSAFAPYLLADDEGLYAAENLSLTFTEGQGAETSAKLIGQGRYKIGTCNTGATATAVDNDVPVLSVAVIEQDAMTAVFSLKKSNIKEPSDLIGKTLGVRYYDISHKEYLAMMRAKGLDATKVKEVNVGWELQPLLTGQVDALYNYAYFMPVILEQQGHELNKILVRDNGVKGYGSNIIVNREFGQTSGDVVKRFLRASRKGWEAALANPDKAVAVLKKRYSETDARVALATLKEQLLWIHSASRNNKIFSQSEDRWAEVLTTYESLGMVKKKLKPADVFSNDYLD